MMSPSPLAARDAVRDEMRLLDPAVDAYLAELARRSRQLGNVHDAEACEHWRGVLRRFREEGLMGGYVAMVVEQIAYANSDDATREILVGNPDLLANETLELIERRIDDLDTVGDVTRAGMYRLAAVHIRTAASPSQQVVSVSAEEAARLAALVEALAAGSLQERRELLERNPDLAQSPTVFIAHAMFDPLLERARANGDLAGVQQVSSAQALLAKAHEVGIARAFTELDQ